MRLCRARNRHAADGPGVWEVSQLEPNRSTVHSMRCRSESAQRPIEARSRTRAFGAGFGFAERPGRRIVAVEAEITRPASLWPPVLAGLVPNCATEILQFNDSPRRGRRGAHACPFCIRCHNPQILWITGCNAEESAAFSSAGTAARYSGAADHDAVGLWPCAMPWPACIVRQSE